MYIDVKRRVPTLQFLDAEARNGFTELSFDGSQYHTVSFCVGRAGHRVPSYLIDDDLVLFHFSQVEILVLEI